MTYVEALIRCRTDLQEAKRVLHTLLSVPGTRSDALLILVHGKIWLARLLRIEGEHAEAKDLCAVSSPPIVVPRLSCIVS